MRGKPLALGLAFAALLVAAPAAGAASGWYELGDGAAPLDRTPSSNPGSSVEKLADVGGVPYAVSLEETNGCCTWFARVAHFTKPLADDPWLFDGDELNVGVVSGGPPTKAFIGGVPYIAYIANDGVHVVKLVGGHWQDITGTGIETNPQFLEVSLTDLNGAPVVAYVVLQSGHYELHVKRLNGSTWSELGTGAAPLPIHDFAQFGGLGLAPVGGVLHLAAGSGNPGQLKVAKYDSGTNSWSQVGGVLNHVATDDVGEADIIDVGGTPHVVWRESGPGSGGVLRVWAKRFTSGSWQDVGGGPANHDASSDAKDVHGANVNGKLLVAFTQDPAGALALGNVYVVRLNDPGTGWDSLGRVAHDPTLRAEASAVGDIGGKPTVAFSEEGEPGGLYHAHVAVYGSGPSNEVRPRLTGTPKVPGTLHCSLGRWDATASEFKTVWQRAPHGTLNQNDPSWHAIDGAVGLDYKLTGDDAGSRIRCLVSAAGSVFVTHVPSNSVQADHGPPKLLAQPKVTGDHRTGHTMTCDPGNWTNNPDFAYEWYGDGQRVPGETHSTYTTKSPRDRDEGLACRVFAGNDIGSFASFSDNVHIVSRKPTGKEPPRLFFDHDLGVGNPVGQTAHCTSGKWNFDYAQYRFVWVRDSNTPIPGASGRTYKTQVADLGHELRCRVASTNPWGESGVLTSNSELVPLPQGVGAGTKFKTGGFNEFDPVNLMALSDPYKAAIDKISTDKYRAAVDSRRAYCKNDFPNRDKIPPPDKLKLLKSDFELLDDLVQCEILVDRPESDLLIGYWGVQYTGPVSEARSQDGKRCTDDRVQRHQCPDTGFYVDPVTPGKEGDLPADLEMKLDPVTPEHVLWDFNNDKKVDADCPSASPVVRSLLDKGHYHVHAVIVDKHSAETGVYWNADFDFDHPKANGLNPGLRPGQVFACRTSLEPPPSSKFLGACLTNSKIGRVQVEGNFCPIDLRNLNPDLLDDLDKQSHDVYVILKEMAEKRDVNAAKRRPKPAHVNVPLGTSSLAAGDASQVFAASGGSISGGQFFSHLSTNAVAFKNTTSALNLADNGKLLSHSDLGFASAVDSIQGELKQKFDPSRFPFALDQIYLGKGPVKVNGTKLDPTGDYEKQPTLVTPSDAGNVAAEGEDAPEKIVKTMLLNNTGVRTALQGPSGEITLDPGSALKREIGDVKDEAQRTLRENLNVDKYKQQLKEEINKKIQDGKDAAAKELQKALGALDLGPLKIAGTSAHVDINDDGTATLTAVATIPFLQDPTAAPTDEDQDPTAPNAKKPDKGAVRVEVTLKGDLTGKLTLQGVHVNLDRADLGVLALRAVDFVYDGGVKLTGNILIPPTNEGVRIEDFSVDKDGKFQGVSVAYLAGAGSGIPIGAPAPVYLTSLGGGFHFAGDVAKLNAAATFSLGPSPTGEGCAALGMKTAANVEIGGVPAFVADVTGNVEVVCIPIGNAHFHVDSTGFVYITAGVDLSLGPVFVNGGMSAAIKLPDWQFTIDGHGGIRHVPFLDDLHVSMAISNIGVAGCGGVHVPLVGRVAGGAGVKFIKGVPPITFPQLVANLRVFTGCDLGDYKTVLKRRAIRKAAVNQTSFTMPAGQRGVLVSLEGAGRAPRVKLKSPSGKVYDPSNATNGVKFTDGIGQIVEDEDRSVAILGKPQAGVWSVITAAGSTGVNRIQIAPVLPPVVVKGTVTGKGAKKTLHYTVGKQAGQVVRFVETTTGSATTIGTVTGGGTGEFTYLTGESKSSKRTVVAQVQESGMPRTNVTIAHYVAPNPRVGKPKHLRVKRKKGKAVVTWRPAQLASSYVVSVTDSHGGRLAYSPTGLTLTVPNVTKKMSLHVKVAAISRAGRRGPAAKATLKGPHKKHKKHKKKHHNGHG